MEKRIQKIEEELRIIAERNARVEADKAWETSFFRTCVLATITYIIAAVLLYLVGTQRFLAGALVPTVGYILSVQTLPAMKRWWVRRFSRTT